MPFKRKKNKPCSRHSDPYSVKTDTSDNWVGARTVIVSMTAKSQILTLGDWLLQVFNFSLARSSFGSRLEP